MRTVNGERLQCNFYSSFSHFESILNIPLGYFQTFPLSLSQSLGSTLEVSCYWKICRGSLPKLTGTHNRIGLIIISRWLNPKQMRLVRVENYLVTEKQNWIDWHDRRSRHATVQNSAAASIVIASPVTVIISDRMSKQPLLSRAFARCRSKQQTRAEPTRFDEALIIDSLVNFLFSLPVFQQWISVQPPIHEKKKKRKKKRNKGQPRNERKRNKRNEQKSGQTVVYQPPFQSETLERN